MRLLLYGYIFLVIYRPFEIWPQLADLRLELWYLLFLVAAWCVSGRKNLAVDRLSLSVFGLLLSLIICWLCSPWADHSFETVYRCLPYFVFYFAVSTLQWSSAELRGLLWCFLLIFLCYMLHSLVEFQSGRYVFRMGIIRLVGVDQVLGDPNSFSASIVYTLTMIAPLWVASQSMVSRAVLASCVVIGIACVVLTGSRAGFVSLFALYALSLILSEHKWRLLGCGAVAGLVILLMVPDQLQARFATILDLDSGPLSAKVSAESRLEGFYQGLSTWNDYFLTGGGPGCWRRATGLQVEAHNLYGQLCAELGLVGIVAFALFIGAYCHGVVGVDKTYGSGRDSTDALFASQLRKSLGVLLLLLLLSGLFSHNLYRYTWVWSATFLCVLRQCSPTRLLERPQPQSTRLLRAA